MTMNVLVFAFREGGIKASLRAACERNAATRLRGWGLFEGWRRLPAPGYIQFDASRHYGDSQDWEAKHVKHVKHRTEQWNMWNQESKTYHISSNFR